MSQCINPKYGDQLYAWELGLLSEEDQDAMELHILDCDNCSAAARDLLPALALLHQDSEIKHLVESLDPEHSSSRAANSPVKPLPVHRTRLLKILPFAAAAVLLVFLIAKDWQFEFNPSQVAVADYGWTNSIAVLPFVDLSEEQDQLHLSRGIAEAINDKLAQSREIKVIAVSSTVQYADSNLSVKALSQRLDVETIVEGSLIRDDARLRITARLIKAKDGQLLWSDQFDVGFESIHDVQDEVSFAIASALQIKLTPQVLGGAGSSHRPSAEAYDYYLRGSHYVNSMFVPWGKYKYIEQGIEMFQKAIALDSLYVDAYVGAAWAYANYNAVVHKAELDSLTWWYCQKAWDLDSTLWSSTFAMGAYLWNAEQYDEAHEKLTVAFEANPNSFELNRFMGDFYRGFGLYDQALPHYNRAVQLGPVQVWTRGMLASIYFNTGRLNKAAEVHLKILEINPGLFPYQARYCWELIAMGKLEQAQKIIDEHINWHNEARPERRINGQMQWARGILRAAKGDRDGALSLFEQDVKGYHRQNIYALLGMNDEAIDRIANRIDSLQITGGYTFYEVDIFYLSLISHPFLQNLQDDPRFQELVKRQRQLHIETLRRFGRRIGQPIS